MIHAAVWAEYRELMTDPAHLMMEVTLHVIVEGILLGLAWPLIRRAIHKHDREVHGHEGD